MHPLMNAPSSQSPPEAPSGAPPEIHPALGGTVGRGVAFMILNAGWSRAISFAAQWVLGILLTEADYGVYAVAMAFGVFVQFIKDGGGRQLLIQRGAAEYPRLAGSVFWLALLFNTLAAAVLAAMSPFIASSYHDPRYVQLLLLIALSLPLSTPGAVLSAKLMMDLRTGPFATIMMGSAVVRYGGTVLLAWLGWGPLSWVLPLVALAVYEGVACLVVTRDWSWLTRPNFALWRELVHTSKWVMMLALALATFNQGAYLVIGKMTSQETTGIFFFAYQIVIQVEVLVAYNLHQVLFPTLVRLNAEPERQRAALLRSLRTLTLVAAPAGLAVALIFEPLEQLLWHGKWAAAVIPVQVLALFMSARVLHPIPDAILQARGKFKRLSMMVLGMGLGAMAVAAAAARWGGGTPVVLSLWVGVYLACACVAFATSALRTVGVGPAQFLRAIMPAWLVSVFAAGVSGLIDHYLLRSMSPVPRMFALGTVYGLILFPALRIALPRHVEEFIRILPSPVRVLGSRFLRLEAA